VIAPRVETSPRGVRRGANLRVGADDVIAMTSPNFVHAIEWCYLILLSHKRSI
jgi:hypothetical protein